MFADLSSGLTVVRCSPFHLPGSLSFMLLFHLYNTLIKALPEMSFISHVFVVSVLHACVCVTDVVLCLCYRPLHAHIPRKEARA